MKTVLFEVQTHFVQRTCFHQKHDKHNFSRVSFATSRLHQKFLNRKMRIKEFLLFFGVKGEYRDYGSDFEAFYDYEYETSEMSESFYSQEEREYDYESEEFEEERSEAGESFFRKRFRKRLIY